MSIHHQTNLASQIEIKRIKIAEMELIEKMKDKKLTKREQFALAAMQGLITKHRNNGLGMNETSLTADAYAIADEMLAYSTK